MPAYGLDCERSLDDMLACLAASTPWPWRRIDGRLRWLEARVSAGGPLDATMFVWGDPGPRWVLEVIPTRRFSVEAFEHVLRTRIVPALGARDTGPVERPPGALAFEHDDSLEALHRQLDRIGPWPWRASESDTYGDSVSAYPVFGLRLRLFVDRGACVLEIHSVDPYTPARREVEETLRRQVLPALGARNVRAADPIT